MSEPAKAAILIVPDTCALLDVVRHSVGLEKGRSHISQFSQVMSLQREASVEIAIGEMVTSEFNANLEDVRRDATNAARQSIQRLTAIVAAHQLLPGLHHATIEIPTAPSVDASWVDRYVDAWIDVIRTMMNTAANVPTDPHDTLLATRRSAAGRAPCTRRGRSNHDAVVVATALRLAGATDQRTVFVSSNTKDFCGSNGELHDDLVDDFESVGLEYTSTWGAVIGSVHEVPAR